MTSHQIGRHAFAARLLKQGKTLKQLQEVGGWSVDSMTMIARVYGHLETGATDTAVREAPVSLRQMLQRGNKSKKNTNLALVTPNPLNYNN